MLSEDQSFVDVEEKIEKLHKKQAKMQELLQKRRDNAFFKPQLDVARMEVRSAHAKLSVLVGNIILTAKNDLSRAHVL